MSSSGQHYCQRSQGLSLQVALCHVLCGELPSQLQHLEDNGVLVRWVVTTAFTCDLLAVGSTVVAAM
jgi:hypothetical protein